MLAFPPTTQLFLADQVRDLLVTTWATPFTPMEGGIPSAGLVLDVVQPADGTQATWKTFVTAFKSVAAGTAAATTRAAFTGAASAEVLIQHGRTDNVVGYWAAGAPGQHGVTTPGKVGYHFQGTLRTPAARSTFSAATTPNWFLAVAGNGYVRIDKTVGGVTTTLLAQAVTEKDYLVNGFALTPTIADMQPGDTLDIYYLQTGSEAWGGFAVKAVPQARSSVATTDQAAAAAAHILGCGLLDDGAPPAAMPLESVTQVSVEARTGAPMTVEVTVPLLNPKEHDGTGWIWVRSTGDDPGAVELWSGGALQGTLRRKRLIQLELGFLDERYPTFTGFIEDFSQPDANSVTISCRSFETRLLEQHDKNFPDPVSYMSRGFRRTNALQSATEPIYPIPAYDNWPVEYAIADLFVRNGIDASRLQAPLTVPQADGSTTPVVNGADTFCTFRARTLNGKLLRLDRAVHYGNAGAAFTERLVADDPYLFRPDVTKDVWNRARELTERLGYELRFDVAGNAVLRPRNNPAFVVDLDASDVTSGSATVKTHPSAWAARYLEFSGAATVVRTLTAARVDIALPLGPTLGDWSFTVTDVATGTPVATGTLGAAGSPTDVFFYDGALNADASNATVATLYSGAYAEYQVTLTATGAGTRRLDCLFGYHTDPMVPRYPATFATNRNALSVHAQSAMDDMRNSVIVVGARKATVTDSTKFNTNPNNPEAEFIVERVVDTASITDPSALNYTGAVKESIIYDSSIGDNAYARYLARVFIYRYRNPKPPVTVTHTIVPMVELRDALLAEETRTGSVGVDGIDARRSVLWVTGYKHTVDTKRAVTELSTQSFPDFPAYEPREDIDLTTFNNKPVINFGITYTALDGTTQTNLPRTAPVLCTERDCVSNVGDWVTVTGLVPSAGTLTIPDDPNYSWPPIPGTVFLSPDFTAPGFTQASFWLYDSQALTGVGGNNAWFTLSSYVNDHVPVSKGMVVGTTHLQDNIGIISVTVDVAGKGTRTALLNDRSAEYYYTIDDEDLITVATGQAFNKPAYVNAFFKWKMGDRDTKLTSTWVTNNPYHHFFNVDYRTSRKALDLVWNQGDSTSAMYQRNPATTSYRVKYRRLAAGDASGNAIDPYAGTGSPFFDPYTSELGYTIQITGDVLMSGLYRVAIRNATDQTVVAWLTEPTADNTQPEAHWSYVQAGAAKVFEWDGVDNVGAWNAKQSVDYAASLTSAFDDSDHVIGAGFYVWNQETGPQAVIAALTDATTGAPIFGHGRFGQWYVTIESKLEVASVLVRSDQLDAANNQGVSEAVIFTHLPDPIQLECRVHDWTSGSAFDPNDVADVSATSAFDPSNWGVPSATENPDAVINNQRPVRLRFRVPQRPGPLWEGFQGATTLKLTRHAHLRTNIHDQFVVSAGTNWAGSSFEDTTIYSRRMTDDTHTLTFVDDNYRTADSLIWNDGDTGTEWVFYPALFQKNFRGFLESIQFGDYLQLQEVPKWSDAQRNQLAGARSRLQLAFMNYLFYLSGYATDRSGRRAWAVNRSFVDQSKIVHNAASDWPDPDAPGTAATASTYQTPWADDPMLQHRRTIVTRQWTDELVHGTAWTQAQMTRFQLASGSVGAALLKHKWGEHSPNATTIGGVSWASLASDLEADNYTQWHTLVPGLGDQDHPKIVDPAYSNLARQIATLSPGTLWTWEAPPVWRPSITRDFHGYRLLPPMVDDPGRRSDNHQYKGGVYQFVDVSLWVNNGTISNSGADAAAGPTWSSPIYDLRQAAGNSPYDSNSKVRFWPGHQVSVTEEPTKSHGVNQFSANYVRQDELVHWEDLRGMFSRGKRPAEQPIKVTPVQPYYQNLYRYGTLLRTGTWSTAVFPMWQADITDYFRMTFREEYYWESGAFFPVAAHGAELLAATNARKTGFLAATPTVEAALHFDDGAWVGWKDDRASGSDAMTGNAVGQASLGHYLAQRDGYAIDGRIITPFEAETHVAAVGPELPETRDMIFHLVLVPERRAVPV